MARALETVSFDKVEKQFERYSEEAMVHPVGVTKDGHVRFVMVPIDEYQRLLRHERIAGRTVELSNEMTEAVRGVEPGAKSFDAETRLGPA